MTRYVVSAIDPSHDWQVLLNKIYKNERRNSPIPTAVMNALENGYHRMQVSRLDIYLENQLDGKPEQQRYFYNGVYVSRAEANNVIRRILNPELLNENTLPLAIRELYTESRLSAPHFTADEELLIPSGKVQIVVQWNQSLMDRPYYSVTVRIPGKQPLYFARMTPSKVADQIFRSVGQKRFGKFTRARKAALDTPQGIANATFNLWRVMEAMGNRGEDWALIGKQMLASVKVIKQGILKNMGRTLDSSTSAGRESYQLYNTILEALNVAAVHAQWLVFPRPKYGTYAYHYQVALAHLLTASNASVTLQSMAQF